MRKHNAVQVTAFFLAVFLAAGILLSGCAKTTGNVSGGPGFPVTVTDGLGREVTVEKLPERIVSLAPANTEILFALGLGEKVVGVTEYCNYPPEAQDKPKVGGFSSPSVELVVAAEPDLVLVTSMHKEYIPQLENAGLTVVAVEAKNLTGVLDATRLVGKVTGTGNEAGELVRGMQARIDAVAVKVQDIPAAERPVVYFEIWPQPPTTGGANSFLHSLIVAAGGRNVAGDLNKDWVTLTPEMLVAENPDVIIFSHHGSSRQTVEDVKSRPGWENVAAIQNDRVYSIADPDIVEIPGPRVVEGLEEIARCIHPGLFE